MKIRIITFHFAGNQGAVLQCYALQNYLRRKGHDVQVINYQPAYHANKYAVIKNPFISARTVWRRTSKKSLIRRMRACAKGFVLGILASVRGTDKVRHQIFAEFTDRHLSQTEKYTSVKQLRRNPPEADVYITGSDQLWNPDLTDFHFDEAYFLKFGGSNVKRLSYAVSLREHYTDQEKKELTQLCADLDGLCVREANADLASCVSQDIVVCMDPTLLLEAGDYAKAESPLEESKPYLFVYGFETNEAIHSAVEKISKERGLTVINGAPNRVRLSCDCKKIYDFGPGEFLSYIKNADYVVTNSFHGTAFSLIYEKNFSVIAHSTRGKRMIDLLEKLGLSDRIWNGETECWQKEIDYQTVGAKLNALRNHAREYFQTHLK